MNLVALNRKDAVRRFQDAQGRVILVGIDCQRAEITIRELGQRHTSRISIPDELRRHFQKLFPIPEPPAQVGSQPTPHLCTVCQEVACECDLRAPNVLPPEPPAFLADQQPDEPKAAQEPAPEPLPDWRPRKWWRSIPSAFFGKGKP